MTREQAKEILSLYRPGSADAADPAFAEALALCERDAELKQWFEHHCALYAALRAKFKQIAVPEGLKEQIIAERRVHSMPLWQRAVLIAGAVAAAVTIFFALPERRPKEPHDFATYRDSMSGFAERGYGMDTNTTDLNQIRQYLAQRKSVADYVLPPELEKNAKAAGCMATTWQGKNVSLICFETGRPLTPNHPSDLWLFVADSTVADDVPKSGKPVFSKGNGLVTASWSIGNRTYVLATLGDNEELLQKYL